MEATLRAYDQEIERLRRQANTLGASARDGAQRLLVELLDCRAAAQSLLQHSRTSDGRHREILQSDLERKIRQLEGCFESFQRYLEKPL
jgi:hypothetical protein